MLSGCQASRTAVDADTFWAKAEEAGYTLYDATSNYSADKGVEAVLAASISSSYDIKFEVVSTIEQAIAAYEENKADFEDLIGSSTANYSSVSVGNYSYYKATANKRYYVISRTSNTFVFIMHPMIIKTK